MAGTNPLDQQFERLGKHLPRAMRNFGRWLRRPRLIWVRIPAGLLLIAAGFLGFLPILGFWMVPLGVIIIAQDVPFIRRPIARALKWGLDKWETRQKKREQR
jgi:purine-cytosine permease-like protein